MRFSRRKGCQQVIKVTEDLKDLNPTDLDFPQGTRLFVSDSLCPYYRGLRNECKKLWINKQIFVTVNGTVGMKLEQDVWCNSITHLDDLKTLFLEETFTISRLSYFSTHLYFFYRFLCCVQVQFGFLVNF